MQARPFRAWGVVAVAAAVTVACGGANRTSAVATPAPAAAPSAASVKPNPAGIAQAKADSLRHPYTTADVEFMYNMVGHHAQALIMAGWAPSHGASSSVQTLCSRIINSQTDEIVTMQNWLRDRQQPVPEARPGAMLMNGTIMDHMLMPGMLTDDQMKELDAARDTTFDRLFLTYMIQHHRGALGMVKDLFGTYGAGQDELIFKFASDVNVDQTTEIARMERMLAMIKIQELSR